MGADQMDAMIARLEGDVEERNAFVQGLIAAAQDDSRNLTDSERQLIADAEGIVQGATEQLDLLYRSRDTTTAARKRAHDVNKELAKLRLGVDNGPVEYRSAGAWALDAYRAAGLNDKAAAERLELFERAAAHQKTSDNLGIIPDPITGEVVNFIDAARPIVGALGARPMPSANWHRPKVTTHTTVAKQGAAGAAADEKTELVSQKMTIVRIPGSAVTYGGYVNVSRQDIDFATPSAMDAVVNDLAAQYAIQTEAALGTVLSGSANAIEIAGAPTAITADNLTDALWAGAAAIYTATKGQGRLYLAVAPDQLRHWGRLFAPVNPQNAQSEGFTAGTFGQGVMGAISGIPVLMSAGLPTGQPNGSAFMFSTAAVEAYEQRVGQLQVTEPSVLGVQVAYAGYFTPMTIEAGGIQKLVNLV